MAPNIYESDEKKAGPWPVRRSNKTGRPFMARTRWKIGRSYAEYVTARTAAWASVRVSRVAMEMPLEPQSRSNIMRLPPRWRI